MASPAQLHLKRDGLYAGRVGSLEDFFVRHVVLPFDAKDGAQAALVKTDLFPIENPGLCTVQEGGNYNGPLYLRLCGEADRLTLLALFDSLPKELLALDKRLSRSLMTLASLEMSLPRYVKCSTAFRLVPSMLV